MTQQSYEKLSTITELERNTRMIVEAEQLLDRLRIEQRELQKKLLNEHGGNGSNGHGNGVRRKLSKTIVDTVRAVEKGAETINQVAKALHVKKPCARMRLYRVTELNLVARTGRGHYAPLPTTETATAH
jgi:hypothetical protein